MRIVKENSSGVWSHKDDDNPKIDLIISNGWCKIDGDVFELYGASSGEVRTALLSDIILEDESTGGGDETFNSSVDLFTRLKELDYPYLNNQSISSSSSGYSHTGAFAGKPVSNQYVWQAGVGINYTQSDVDAELYKVFSLSREVHDAVDNPYWTTPTPTGNTGIGLFQGANLPDGVSSLVDYDYDFDANYPASTGTGFEGSTGRIKLNDLRYGDQLRVRFDFNAIPQIANTTLEPALWYSNRDDSDNITFTFPLTTQPIFFGAGTVANTYLNRVEISAWITSNEDVNALTLPAIKADNPIIIQPLGLLITIIR